MHADDVAQERRGSLGHGLSSEAWREARRLCGARQTEGSSRSPKHIQPHFALYSSCRGSRGCGPTELFARAVHGRCGILWRSLLRKSSHSKDKAVSSSGGVRRAISHPRGSRPKSIQDSGGGSASGRWRLASHVEAMEAFDCQQKGHVASESTSVSLHHRPDFSGKTLGITHCSGTERRLPTRTHTHWPGSFRQPDNHHLSHRQQPSSRRAAIAREAPLLRSTSRQGMPAKGKR